MADTPRFPGDDGWLIQITSRVKRLEDALKLARPVLAGELESLCYSFCPPCEEGELYDYSELREPQLGWITEAEAALDAVDAALAELIVESPASEVKP